MSFFNSTMLNCFRKLNTKSITFTACRMSSAVPAVDPSQQASLKEVCILVDENDTVIGNASKRDCHRVGANGHLLLHRAFSVFLFNSKNELLLQKRSHAKITFPGYFTNTCCSHPLHEIEQERDECEAKGVKLAAQRRLNFELGIPMEEIDINDFNYLTRIIYKSLGDGVWGEYEIDYILFLQKDVTLNPNPSEISQLNYVSRDKFNAFLKNLDSPLTPWFQLIVKNRLGDWWNNLNKLDIFKDHHTIHSFLK